MHTSSSASSRPATPQGVFPSLTSRVLRLAYRTERLPQSKPVLFDAQFILLTGGHSRMYLVYADGSVATLSWDSPDGKRRPEYWHTDWIDPTGVVRIRERLDGQPLVEAILSDKQALAEYALKFRRELNCIAAGKPVQNLRETAEGLLERRLAGGGSMLVTRVTFTLSQGARDRQKRVTAGTRKRQGVSVIGFGGP